MKAVVFFHHGAPDVLQFKDTEKPLPEDDQLLIKVFAASVNAMDSHLLRGLPYITRMIDTLFTPKQKIPGVDLAGRIEAIGKAVTKFQVGDEVFGRGNGTFAEYACAREDAVVPKPATMPFAAAAAVPVAALTALQGLRDIGKIQSGQKVLINGAGGGVGTFAVQIAKSFGADVTAVCGPGNLEMVRSIGANHVFDYTQEDFTKSQHRYDLIMSINGYHPLFAYRRVLHPGGTYVLVGASKPHLFKAVLQTMLLGPLISRIGNRKVRFFVAKIKRKDLVFVKELLEAGKIKPVIDRCFPLSETAEAIRYLEHCHAQGKVVITVGHDEGI